MNDISFNRWNTILGWTCFAISLITYSLTLDPSVSAWDCGEYIATSAKLEVGHPPGAPLFQMIGAFFSMFTNDVTQIAKMVNFMSAISSAFTILFLFWTITILIKKLVVKSSGLTNHKAISILSAAFVGSLSYTFSDSFWFSAVEGEVYAMSSFLMSLLFWLGLSWQRDMDQPGGNKWLLLISFVTGLSFGVHILSLLVLPSIVFLYILKKYTITTVKKFIIANLVAVFVLLFVFKFLFPMTLKYFSILELFFVNTVGLPFNSGSVIAGTLLLFAFYFGIRYTHKEQLVGVNTLLLSVLFIMLGFSSWLMLPIRANANTTINENNPSSARELLAYYNREQYGNTNVFYDTYYSYSYNKTVDKKNPTRDDKPKYEKDKKTGKYIVVNHFKDSLPNWSDSHKGIIPRMIDPNPDIIESYKAIAGIPQNSKRRPTLIENLKFMFSYQFGYMYGRYFMWNFVGRQNDIQGKLDIYNGNWLSGINMIDESRLGSQQNLPTDILNNKGRNTYYFLPFVFGLLGLLYQIKYDKFNFYTLFLFFVFTGFAIIFYTNPKPFEPRERDYAVVGSFYIFTIWIGFGVFATHEFVKKTSKIKVLTPLVFILSVISVPGLMAFENWDDHDRSNRFTTHMMAQAYLDSCDPNAIMFTLGDNDSFPLWYMQEVEGYRTDIKLIVTSYFATDWYIDQMKRATYKAPPIPSQLTHEKYKYGSLDVAYYSPIPQFKNSILNIKDFIRWIESDNEITFHKTENGERIKIYPTNKIRIPIDKNVILNNGIVSKKDSDKIVEYIDITIDNFLTKNRILMLDILANNNWKQPIYFSGGANAAEEYIWLKDYLQLEGLCYKLVPIKTPAADKSLLNLGRVDTQTMLDKVKKWNWKNINDGKIYLDEQTKRNLISFRNSLSRLVEALIEEKNFDKAEEILDLSLEKMPIQDFGHITLSIDFPHYYYSIGRQKKAREVTSTLLGIYKQKLEWYATFESTQINSIADDLNLALYVYSNIIQQVQKFEKDEIYIKKLENNFIDVTESIRFLDTQ